MSPLAILPLAGPRLSLHGVRGKPACIHSTECRSEQCSGGYTLWKVRGKGVVRLLPNALVHQSLYFLDHHSWRVCGWALKSSETLSYAGAKGGGVANAFSIQVRYKHFSRFLFSTSNPQESPPRRRPWRPPSP